MKFTILISLILGILLSGCAQLTPVVDEKIFTITEELPIELQQDERFIDCLVNNENGDFQCATMSHDWDCQIGDSFIFDKRKCVCKDHCPNDVQCDDDLGTLWDCRYDSRIEKAFTTIEELPIELQQDESFQECVIDSDEIYCGAMSDDWDCQVGDSFIFEKRQCLCRDHCPDDAECLMDFGTIWECDRCYDSFCRFRALS